MICIYYIGGPWDLIKRVIPREPTSTVTIREYEPPNGSRDASSGTAPFPLDAEVQWRDHRYGVRKIGRDTFVAVHEGLLP